MVIAIKMYSDNKLSAAYESSCLFINNNMIKLYKAYQVHVSIVQDNGVTFHHFIAITNINGHSMNNNPIILAKYV